MKIIKNNKVYILMDDCVWDYEGSTKVVAVSLNKEDIKQIMNDYIDQVKKDIDFESLNIVENDSEYGCIVYETDISFSLYINGEHISNHIEIYIDEKELVTYKDYENKNGSYEK